MKIFKFGGSSLATADRIRNVVEIIAAARRDDKVAVVVSALGGVSDALLEAAERASTGETDFGERLQELEARHLEALNDVASPEDAVATRE